MDDPPQDPLTSSRGATSQEVRGESQGRRGGGAFQRIREAMLNDSVTTAEVSDEDDEDTKATIKVGAFVGGSRAENWMESILCKLTETQEAA